MMRKREEPYRYTLPHSISELKRLDGMYERMQRGDHHSCLVQRKSSEGVSLLADSDSFDNVACLHEHQGHERGLARPKSSCLSGRRILEVLGDRYPEVSRLRRSLLKIRHWISVGIIMHGYCIYCMILLK